MAPTLGVMNESEVCSVRLRGDLLPLSIFDSDGQPLRATRLIIDLVPVDDARREQYLLRFVGSDGEDLEVMQFDTLPIALDQAAAVVGVMPDEWVSTEHGKPLIVLDGGRVQDLTGFYEEASRVLMPDADFKMGNLDGFNDVLWGGFGTPEGGYVLRWVGADHCRQALGWPETVRYLERKITTCHSVNVPRVQAELDAARRSEGQTLFDTLVEIVEEHSLDPPRGGGVVLELA